MLDFCLVTVGIGLKQVLVINLSKSASYHMLRAPAAPAPIATKNIEKTKMLRFQAQLINQLHK